ncbi:hypothetical protein FHX44_113279 [Pseudonocardia hierapolitana]|uniref:Uncharacterized protein n=1 Tax=Pseudonocardia hierapolitana TaxID=1128676 RepID=A0A561SR60_9PSEU|nr:hypothetical protein FHX44_113279 [Pseudonocardia hierapolitana]
MSPLLRFLSLIAAHFSRTLSNCPDNLSGNGPRIFSRRFPNR